MSHLGESVVEYGGGGGGRRTRVGRTRRTEGGKPKAILQDDGDEGSDSEYKDDEGTSEESPPWKSHFQDTSAALTLPEMAALRERVRIAMQAKGIPTLTRRRRTDPRMGGATIHRREVQVSPVPISCCPLGSLAGKEESVSLSSLLRTNFSIPRASGNSRPTTIHRVAKMYIKRHKRYLISEGTSHGRSSWHCKGCDFKLAIRAGMRQLQTVKLRAPWHEEWCRYYEEKEGVWGRPARQPGRSRWKGIP